MALVLSESMRLSCPKMNLRDFLNRDGKTHELYWALSIEADWVQSAIWYIEGEVAQVVATSPVSAWQTEEELIEATDASLSAAIQNLPEDTKEPEKTVFGVPPGWVSDGQIKEEYLLKIKKICSELSLSPSGFVILPEAIAHLIKSEEEAPLTAIVLGVSKENIELSLFRLGNLIGNTTVARSVSIFDDAIEGLTRFGTQDPLPSRIIIYDGKEGQLEDLRQELIKADWKEIENLKFLHTPKVEVLDSEKKVAAVSLAGASEMGNVTAIVTEKEDKEDQAEALAVEEEPNFSEAGDISAEELGFVVGKDVSEEETPTIPATPVTQESGDQEFIAGDGKLSHDKAPTVAHFPSASKFSGLTSRVLDFAKSLAGKVPPRMGAGAAGKRPLIFAALGGLFVALALAWWFLPKATVAIYVAPQSTSATFPVNLDSNVSSPRLSEKMLNAVLISTQASGEKSRGTTGRKTVGDRAKGSVQVRNGNSAPVNLPAGTVFLSSNNLEFSLDKSASIAGSLSPVTPGTAEVDITARAIGAEYNLGKDETFKIGNYPKADIDAVAINQLTGGSSREISAISESDQQSLRDELTKELTEKAKQDLFGKISSEQYFIENSLQTQVVTSSFSGRVGDESSNLSLSLNISVSGLAVDRNLIYELSSEELKDRIPGGYILRNDQMRLQFDLKDQKDGVYEFEADIAANLLPEINPDEIAKKIAGRNPVRAEEYLRTVPGFRRAEITFSPRLPGFLGIMPRVSRNINIEIGAER